MMRKALALSALSLTLAAGCSHNRYDYRDDRYGSGRRRGDYYGSMALDDALRGIRLSSDQQWRVQAIRERYERVLSRDRREGAGRWNRDVRRELSEVRSILDGRQRRRFDENLEDRR